MPLTTKIKNYKGNPVLKPSKANGLTNESEMLVFHIRSVVPGLKFQYFYRSMRDNSEDLKVFISNRESVCSECHENLGSQAWIFLTREQEALCLSCADMDHLEFLPSGDKALTLRARKYSSLNAIVLKWSKARKHYERQGLLVQKDAIEKAEEECLKIEDIRERRKLREAEKRELADEHYVRRFTERIQELYPKCPEGCAKIIAEHACQKYSGRVGRTAAAKSFDETVIKLAAHIRHALTEYDELLSKGYERSEARESVVGKVFGILEKWKM
jgi:predicted CXXCH cytochrome family protein